MSRLSWQGSKITGEWKIGSMGPGALRDASMDVAPNSRDQPGGHLKGSVSSFFIVYSREEPPLWPGGKSRRKGKSTFFTHWWGASCEVEAEGSYNGRA